MRRNWWLWQWTQERQRGAIFPSDQNPIYKETWTRWWRCPSALFPPGCSPAAGASWQHNHPSQAQTLGAFPNLPCSLLCFVPPTLKSSVMPASVAISKENSVLQLGQFVNTSETNYVYTEQTPALKLQLHLKGFVLTQKILRPLRIKQAALRTSQAQFTLQCSVAIT